MTIGTDKPRMGTVQWFCHRSRSYNEFIADTMKPYVCKRMEICLVVNLLHI